jgi:tetratricopeptide (TPR) repeat protein
MTLDIRTEYESLTAEEAAQIDVLCDCFERAWKDARSSGELPCVANYLTIGGGIARDFLFRELVALDQACRARYGIAAGPADTEPFSTAAEAPTDWPSIPGFELEEVLGWGGMGVIFKARQSTLDRDVAIKLLRDGHRNDSEQRERFLQEARTVARLRHPHLVQVYGFGEVPALGGATSRPYLVLEYVSGCSLADLVRASPQPPREAARLIETVAAAIHYAHEQGVIHRDLKPANILLSGPGDLSAVRLRGPKPKPLRTLAADICAKVTDFGLAKFLAGTDITQSGELLGTPSYMAPEQATGTGAVITTAVDVYGLGAILYETLTGRPPFSAATLEATLGQVRHDEPVPPRRLQPTVPRDLETICLKCLRKEAGRRYATAQELADDLRRFRNGEPIRARPVVMAERVIVWCRRRPGVAALLVALVLVFVAGGAGVLWQWQRAGRNAVEAQRNADAFQRERDTARQEQQRAERHLEIVCQRVDRLNRLGRSLLRRPGQYRTGQAVLEEALAFYQELLPDEGNDPKLRREAAKLYRQVAGIQFTLGQADKAADAYDRQASLLISLLEEEPRSRDLRYQLAHCQRWRGNLARDMGKTRAAQDAYDRAAELQEELLVEMPDEARYNTALANTLLNKATLLSLPNDAEELEKLYDRILKLDRMAVGITPDVPGIDSELALALSDQGMFFLHTGHSSQAEAAVRESLMIYRKMLERGQLKGYIDRYAARAFFNLGQVLATNGEASEAEQLYEEGVQVLDRYVQQYPDSAIGHVSLAEALAGQCEILQDLDRRNETEAIRRRVIDQYEYLHGQFPDDPQHRCALVRSYLELASVLGQLGRSAEAGDPFQKALAVEPDDAAVNNELAWFLATTPEPCLRDVERALRLAKKAVAARPESGDYRRTLGVAEFRNGDDKAAVAELEAVVAKWTGTSLDRFILAMAHWRLGHYEEARMWFGRAVKELDRYKSPEDGLRRLRAEAQDMLAEVPRH